MIRKLLIGAAAAAAFAGLAGAADAATVSSTATNNASVKITVPTTVTQTSGIAFGTIVRPLTGTSTVSIAAAQSATATGPGQSGASNPAAFDVTGEGADMGVHATLSFGATDDAKFGTITATPSVSSLTLDSSNQWASTIYVGGTIPVKSTTPPGNYLGTLTLSVDFP